MSVFAPMLGALWRQLEGYGVDPEPLFRQEGVDPETLFDAGARIAVPHSQSLYHLAAERVGDPLFGLKTAHYIRPAHLGALGFAWLASSSLRKGFERLNRYAQMIQKRMVILLDEDDDCFYVTIDPQVPAPDEAVREDRLLATLITFCRIIAGRQFNPTRIWFRHPTPADTGLYYKLFRCPLEFGTAETKMAISLSDVDRRLTGANDELAQMNEHIVVKYLACVARKDIVNRSKAAIIDGLPSGTANENAVAESLHMTPRNLHRKLQKEGTSFKQLLTDVRRELAAQYIQDRSRTLTEISYLLGFSEVSSFSRAYKGWTGQPPSEARRAVE
jgi:AraC-like DNA-binding protein